MSELARFSDHNKWKAGLVSGIVEALNHLRWIHYNHEAKLHIQ